MNPLKDDIERLSSRIAEIDTTIEELSTRIDDRSNVRSELYRAMYREHLRIRNTAAQKLNELTAREKVLERSLTGRRASAADAPHKPAAVRLHLVS